MESTGAVSLRSRLAAHWGLVQCNEGWQELSGGECSCHCFAWAVLQEPPTT